MRSSSLVTWLLACVSLSAAAAVAPAPTEVRRQLATTTTTSATVTGSPKPSPTQPGLIETCTTFYKAILGDTCIGIVNKNNGAFTLNDFYRWNPAVGDDCLGLWANTYYCIGVPGTATTLSTTTTKQGNGIPTPVPTQSGMVNNCNQFYLVKSGDTCKKISTEFFIPESDLKTWNPAVLSDCRNLWADTYFCVEVVGYVPSRTSTCNTGTLTKTWGDNRPAALQAILDFCSTGPNGFPNGGAVYNIDQRKIGCFNAPLGTNKFSFEVHNQWGKRNALVRPNCEEFAKVPVSDCDRGGVLRVQGWQFTANVTAGRC
ncbi:LysM domain-containing protein [Paramyrothecium foliicola]|nr:LysM domain-containing protein [Paramyrothecium foliicola]